MKMAAGPLIDVQVERDLVALLRSGTEFDRVMRFMREKGLSKINSMKMLRDHGGMPLGEAKRIVHLSSVWADRVEADDVFQGTVERAVQDDGFVQTASDAVKRPA